MSNPPTQTQDQPSEAMVQAAARAMKLRASQPVGNLPSLEPVLVGSLGDAWSYLAKVALIAGIAAALEKGR